LLATPDAAALIAPDGSVPDDELRAIGLDLRPYAAYDAERLVDAIGSATDALRETAMQLGLRGRHIAVELDHLPAAALRSLEPSEIADLASPLAAWRMVKDEAELMRIRRSAAILDEAFAAVGAAVRAGISEHELFALARAAVQEQTTEPLSFDPILDANLGTGSRSAEADPHPGPSRLAEGDLVLVDLYPTIEGYVADLARTVAVGEPTPVQLELHAALEEALDAGERTLRAGTPAREVAAAVRAALHPTGIAASMAHHAGHGLGLFAWERPWIGEADETRLAPGMVVALEPGLYQPGACGIRQESMFLVTQDEPERLDRAPRTLRLAGWAGLS
jgi:Xaa-Pro aminopeptidase